ncbi:probable galacturonosyltransferase 15 [Ricinus communis]|uniref:Hexosyltransferase n=1 Tax=Ricinus communis TaxID=3988 RepID=B9S311_RICCO|nr:probable galacturonosyltransferase 15 [Ricinus communis]XP_015575445.1 probable galacturonosyltransferase 15 [Ricinus communis]XP_015575446.1 probable galacturonosyltransferase 15 [Ricinus communis]EEF41996.1 Glycosyltransferase QUASIMODO1, putative [Ricinus communis]|eukprot:XP_002520380.1 probable galacturonosyltransferase 15 [Ricinus communis]
MKFYISTTGIKRVTISNPGCGGGGGGKGSSIKVAAGRRISGRTLLPVLLVLAIVLPFLFVRIAFLVLESASACNSSVDCRPWRFFGGSDTSMKLREELTRALLEAKESGIDDEKMDDSTASFNELVKEMTSTRQDIKAFAFRTKAMLSKMEHKVQLARQRESIFWHLASHGIPKSLHCLCLKLSEEYAVNAIARSRLPPPEYVSRLADPSFHHVVLITDNVLAASVVISSTVQNSLSPEKLVFHIITDKKTYTPMHAWFAINTIKSAAVEIKGLHQYDWSEEVNIGVKEMLETHRLIWSHYYTNMKEEDFLHEGEHKRSLEALSPSCLSLLNHLRIYLPELFPDLNKIVFLDDDVVVQHDISSLWEMDLNEKVVGAVVDSWCGENCCPARRYKDYLNFSHSIISSNLDPERCAWLYGMNVFDLDTWRRANITRNYHKWLKHSRKSGLDLWQPGVLPPALLAFEGHVHPIDPSWHLAGLGRKPPEVRREILETAAILHFNGPAKPWLEIGFPEVQSLWIKHVNFSNEFIRKCRIAG